ncbi:MAG: hypothetical protein AB2L18_06475 [Anaerolineaceae bacterium]
MNDFRRMFPKVEVLFLGGTFGGIFPILCFLIGWWGSLSILPEGSIKYAALGGLLIGIIIDILFLKKWILNAYTLDLKWLVVIYLFFSIGLFGFFMGVPIFNVLQGLFAGFYMGLRMADGKKSNEEAEGVFRKTGFFASFVLAVVCLASLWLAGTDSTTAANINGMLALRQPLTQQSIMTVSAVGGVVMVVLEFFITHGIARWAYK